MSHTFRKAPRGDGGSREVDTNNVDCGKEGKNQTDRCSEPLRLMICRAQDGEHDDRAEEENGGIGEEVYPGDELEYIGIVCY